VDRFQSASDSEELTASIFRVVKVEYCEAWDYAENVVSKLLQNFSSLAIKANWHWESLLEESAWSPKTWGVNRISANLQLGIPVEMDTGELPAALHNAHFGNITTFQFISYTLILLQTME
jgi:hypothetical protein